PLVRDYACFHITVAVLCSAWATARLRGVALRQIMAAVPRFSVHADYALRPRVGRLPMVWKELFVERGLRLNWIGWLVLVGLFAVSLYLFLGTGSQLFDELFGWSGYYSRYDRSSLFKQLFSWKRLDGMPGRMLLAERWRLLSELFHPWVRVMGTLVASLMLVGVAVRAAGGISGERERQTLDGLLTSPLESHDILFGKWLGSLLGVRKAWGWLGLIWGVGILTGGLHPAPLMLAFVAWLVYASCLAGVGLWFSISCRTTLRATLYTLITILVASVGHW